MLRGLLLAAAATLVAAPAYADVTISSQPTANMSCSGGVCSPTATSAVLNVGDLDSLLASGNVTVTTTGSGLQATNIVVSAPLSWSSASTLGFDAYQSLSVSKAISVAGTGGVSVATNDGGSNGFFSFGQKGHVTLANLSSSLSINGSAYTLEGDIKSLASAIAANPDGNFALAGDYDASLDGKYAEPPIVTQFLGNFEGLGNSISKLTIETHARGLGAGLFAEVEGSVENLRLRHMNVTEKRQNVSVGGIAGYNQGLLYGVYVDGTVSGADDTVVGGVVGGNAGTVLNSSSSATIHGREGAICGGLAGVSNGTVSGSFADDSIGWYKGCQFAGGLVGQNRGAIDNSYAVGNVITGNTETQGGGFIGQDDSSIDQVSNSYSTGSVEAEYAGGFIGFVYSGSWSDCYWDTTTSGTNDGEEGGNIPGVTGLTSKQLRSGLPSGFDPTIWAEDKKINNGFPYLIANPPPK